MNSTDFLLWLQDHRNPLLTTVFGALTFLGSEDFLLLLVPVVYWCINRTLGLRITLALLGSQYLNQTLKEWIAEPRPGPPLITLLPDTGGGYGFPSGHAQNSAALWGTLAGLLRQPRIWPAVISLVALVGFSRLYLALHWPLDVLGGWAIGAAITVAALALIRQGGQIAAQRIRPLLLLGVLAVPLALLAIEADTTNAKTAGAALGLIAGWWLERRMVGFEAGAPARQQVIKAVLGLTVAFSLRVALKPLLDVLPIPLLPDLIRYTAIGLWIAWLAPLVFVRLFGRPVSPPD